MEPEPEPDPEPANKMKPGYEPEVEPFAGYLLSDYHQSWIQNRPWDELALGQDE